VKLKLRHVYAALGAITALFTVVYALLAVLALMAGDWLRVAVTSAAVLLILLGSQLLLPRRPSRAQRTAAVKALYFEAERLIFAMTPQQPYRAGDVLLVRMRKPGLARVLRLDLASCMDRSHVDDSDVLVTEALTLFVPPPLVYSSVAGDRVYPTSEGTLTFLDAPSRSTLRDTWRELRLIRTVGTGLLSADELRTLVEQLRIAEPLQA
jgi:hypothetical protein